MNDMQIITSSGMETMTSLQIAEVTGKQHKDVLEAIRKMEPAWEAVRGRKFPLTFRITQLPNGAERKDPLYVLIKLLREKFPSVNTRTQKGKCAPCMH